MGRYRDADPLRLRPAVVLAAALLLGAWAPAKLMDWDDLVARPLPQADVRIAYGAAPEQFAELWTPAGRGPFPVVLMIHGGCWRSNLAQLTIMNYAAADLRRRGIAVWNVEYRGIDRPGGGYPGTFQDVAAAAAALQTAAPAHRLDLDRLVFVGHSAGGHLAAWLAGANRIGKGPLAHAATLRPREVVSLGGLPDLSTASAGCGAKAVKAMTGEPGPDRPDPLADTSAAALLPFGVGQVVLNGAEDDTSTPDLARAYAAKALAAGDRVERIVVPGEGHVEEIAPGSAAWNRAAARIVEAARRRH